MTVYLLWANRNWNHTDLAFQSLCTIYKHNQFPTQLSAYKVVTAQRPGYAKNFHLMPSYHLKEPQSFYVQWKSIP